MPDIATVYSYRSYYSVKNVKHNMQRWSTNVLYSFLYTKYRLSWLFTPILVIINSYIALKSNITAVAILPSMMTSSNGNIFRVTGLAGNSPVTGEFPAQRPVMRSCDVFFDLGLNQQLSKQWRRRWFETPPLSLWRQCDGYLYLSTCSISLWLKLTQNCGCLPKYTSLDLA